MTDGGRRRRDPGLAVFAVQLRQVSREVRMARKELAAHRAEHQAAETARAGSRRWIIMAVIAAIAAIDAPLVTVLLALHR